MNNKSRDCVNDVLRRLSRVRSDEPMLRLKKAELVVRLDRAEKELSALKQERDEALEELKYLRGHMENAGGDNWADAETHEIRSYLRSIIRGCKIKV